MIIPEESRSKTGALIGVGPGPCELPRMPPYLYVCRPATYPGRRSREPRMACERLAIGDGCRRIAPRSPMRRPRPLIEIGEVEKNSLRREPSAGYSESNLG